jgi:hypothetical protein
MSGALHGSGGWLAIAAMVGVGLLFSTPFLLSAIGGAGFLDIANEPLAYRFFYSERMFAGDNSVVVGVGYLVSVLHHAVYVTLHAFPAIVAASLERRLDLFALVTNGLLSAAACALLVVAARAPGRSPHELAIIALVALVPIFGTQRVGFDYALMADYHFLDLVLCIATVVVFQRAWRRGAGVPSRRELAWSAAFVGMAVANKVTMLTVAGVVLVPLLAPVAGAGRVMAGRAVLAAGSAALAFVAVHAISYLGDLQALATAARIWFSFVSKPGAEPDFWGALFGAFLRDFNYDLLFPFGIAASLLAAGRLWVVRHADRRSLLLAAFCLASVAANILFLVKRPAGSTLFESCVFILTVGCVALGAVSAWKPVQRFVAAACVAWSAVAVATFAYAYAYDLVAGSTVRAREKWDAFDATRRLAGRGPIEVIFPDNSFHHEGVFELLLKGSTDFPTWHIGVGGKVLDRYAPGLSFRHNYEGLRPDAPYAGGRTLVWFDSAGLQPATVRYPTLAEVLARPGVEPHAFLLRPKGGGPEVTMRVAVIPFDH